MQNYKYSKNIRVWENEKVYIEWVDWELREAEVKQKWLSNFKSNRHFMKLFLSQDIVADKVWDDYKYIAYISSVLWFDNAINITRFREKIAISNQAFYALKKRLIEKWVMKQIWKEFFLNPFIWVKAETISYDLSQEFKEINSKLYWITEL
jgi:hypothetical protein